MKKTETFLTSNNQLAAFLIARGFSSRAVNVEGAIKIELSGNNIQEALESFYANALIPVQSYLMAFESLRGAVAVARGRHA